MSAAFGPESTNPRLRRAYAHTLIARALASGLPADKLSALEAANMSSRTAKGRGLGEQALHSILGQYENATGAFVSSPDRTWDEVLRSNQSKDTLPRLYCAVNEALGASAGITISRPLTDTDTIIASRAWVWAGRPQSYGDTLTVTEDYSVPGTAYRTDLVQALAFDASRLISRSAA